MGKNWAQQQDFTVSQLRGSIGRFFKEPFFLHDRTLLDNIMLSALYHTKRTHNDIEKEVEARAHDFGLPGIPCSTVSNATSWDLRIAALIRSLIGSPRLLILEQPLEQLGQEIVPALINTLTTMRLQGTSVIWITTTFFENIIQSVHPTITAIVEGSQFYVKRQTTMTSSQ